MIFRPCPICGDPEIRILLPSPGAYVEGSPYELCGTHVSICTTCGFLFVDPLPERAEIRRFEIAQVEESGRRAEARYLRSAYPDRLERLRGCWRGAPPRRVLHIGSDAGPFSAALREVFGDCEIHGLETDPRAVRESRKAYGLEHLRCGSIEQCTFPENAFDLVTVNQLHHLGDPGAALETIRRILRPGAPLYLEMERLLLQDGFRGWPGYMMDLDDLFYLCPFTKGWFHEDHVVHLVLDHGYRILEGGTFPYRHLPFRAGEPGCEEAVRWMFLEPAPASGDDRPRPYEGVTHTEVLEHVLGLAEAVTVESVRRKMRGTETRVGLLGTKRENDRLGDILAKTFPGLILLAAELRLPEALGDEPGAGGPHAITDGLDLPRLVSGHQDLDLILLTSHVDEPRFDHLRHQLRVVTDRVYRCIYKRPPSLLPPERVVNRNRLLGQEILLKAFFPHRKWPGYLDEEA